VTILSHLTDGANSSSRAPQQKAPRRRQPQGRIGRRQQLLNSGAGTDQDQAPNPNPSAPSSIPPSLTNHVHDGRSSDENDRKRMSAAKGSGIEPVETLGSPVTGSKPAKGSESHERCRRQARACEQRRPGRVSERLAGSGTPGEEAPRRMTRGGQRIARLLKSEVVRGTVRAKKRIVLADQRCPVPFSRRFQAACQKTSLNEKAISSRSPPIGLPRPTFA
jgi:hypothetical protein